MNRVLRRSTSIETSSLIRSWLFVECVSSHKYNIVKQSEHGKTFLILPAHFYNFDMFTLLLEQLQNTATSTKYYNNNKTLQQQQRNTTTTTTKHYNNNNKTLQQQQQNTTTTTTKHYNNYKTL
ncbi:unnamed protein product [Albugo candida]|uniref:Uncharacterized protein n=1 Tax=Albugo candida TaxID=65357 RepID=A0A024GQK5_9STRA|nr:unnamed protein product [Albugo candida]|eukprot:CCI48643.1 unnamed protein product [Albugo candida]